MKKSHLVKTAVSSALFSTLLLGSRAVAADDLAQVQPEASHPAESLAIVTAPEVQSATTEVGAEASVAEAPLASSQILATATSEPEATVQATSSSQSSPVLSSELAASQDSQPQVQPASIASTNQTGGSWNGDRTGYKNAAGQWVTGRQTIDGKDYFFASSSLPSSDLAMEDQAGQVLSKEDVLHDKAGHYYYSQSNGEFLKNGFSKLNAARVYYADKNGYLQKGDVYVDGKHYFFHDSYAMSKGSTYTRPDGKKGYTDKATGQVLTNQWIDELRGDYYATADGSLATGLVSIDGKQYYFGKDNYQVTSGTVVDDQGYVYKIAADKTAVRFNQAQGFFSTKPGQWYYLQENGKVAKGTKVINGKTLFFNQDGQQVKGTAAVAEDGNRYYYDIATGERLYNRYVVEFNTLGNGQTYATELWRYVGTDGRVLTGTHQIDGKTVFFDQDGYQIKGAFAVAEDGKEYYYDAADGHRVYNAYVTTYETIRKAGASYGRRYTSTNWYYVGADGQKLKGYQTINGEKVYFDPTTGLQNKSYKG